MVRALTAAASGVAEGGAESPEEPLLRSDAPSRSSGELVQQSAPESGPPRWLDSLPLGLRLAQQGDEGRLFDIFFRAYRENGFGGIDTDIVRMVIGMACKHEKYVIGLIDGSTEIEAVLGLQLEKSWYGDEDSWGWKDLMFYVRPEYRKTRHAIKLFRFASWWEKHIRMPVLLSIFPCEDLEGKEHLFGRYAKRAGGLYLVGDGTFHPRPAESA